MRLRAEPPGRDQLRSRHRSTAPRVSDATTQLVAPRRLRVAIHAADPLRRAALRSLIVNADHDVADSTEAADVVLCDGDCPSTEGRPFVMLGGTDTDLA